MVRAHPSQPEKSTCASKCFFLSNPKDWYVITRRVYGIAVGVWHHAPACICLRIDAIHHFVMISYGTLCRFHAATSCGFHTRLRRDWDAEDAHQTRGQIRTATFFKLKNGCRRSDTLPYRDYSFTISSPGLLGTMGAMI